MRRIAKRFLPIILLSSFAIALRAGADTEPQRISITAHRFSYQPNKITVQRGRPVILELTSKDVTHGLKCKELGFDATIHKGKITEVKFTPQETGQFSCRCSHFCGMGHGSMTMIIDVVNK